MKQKVIYFFKRNAKRIIPIGWILLGCILGSAIMVLVYNLTKTNLSVKESYDIWDISVFLSQIFGAIGTFLAVVVALFKETIMKAIFSPYLIVRQDLKENVTDAQIPVATSYESFIEIENAGSLVASKCKILMKSVKHGTTRDNVRIVNYTNSNYLYLPTMPLDIQKGLSAKVQLFKIDNPATFGTPNSHTAPPKPILAFNGFDLRRINSEKGYWIIEYYMTCQGELVLKFCLTLEWNGEFKSRKTEMEDVLTIQITRL